jgi:hypothetical protein
LADPLYEAAAHERLTERGWDAEFVEARVAAIVADAEGALDRGGWPVHPGDEGGDLLSARPTTLYLGTAGMIWGLQRLGSSLDLGALAAEVLQRSDREPDFDEDTPNSLHFGETGVLLVAHLIGVTDGDDRLRERISENVRNDTWELMWGSAGSIIAARAVGFAKEAAESAAVLAAEWDRETGVWTQTIGGRTRTYLGPAHGFAGNVHALRGFLSDDDLRARIEPPLRRHAAVEGGLANWPPRVGDGLDRLQWCHGAAGIVATLGDLMPLDLMLAGAELTWQAGPLVKGPGLCHGTVGNGYALLKAHAVTGDELWLDRARKFAVHALEQVERGQGRYTLFTGDIGAALFARSCLHVDARFPTMDVW